MIIKLLQNHTHQNNDWVIGQKVNVLKSLGNQLISDGIAVAADGDCGCGN